VRVNGDPFLLSLPTGLAEDGSSLAWWGGDDHVRFLAYTLWFWILCTCTRQRERDTPEHVPAAVKLWLLQWRSTRVPF
jgi:hypothetical protein